MTFFSFLEARVRAVDSLVCIGLDPHLEELSTPNAEAAYEFCMRLIDATSPYAAAFKPNMAFFEVFGAEGIAVLKRVVNTIPDDIPVILDAKRGDIPSSARAYAQAAFQAMNADAITVSPYLGQDGVSAFLDDPERGVFLLCKTSNDGASDLQDVITLDPKHPARRLLVYERIAELAVQWNQGGNLGLVVGSTYPDALARVREIAPEMWLLAPGVGAQGADIRSALGAGLREDKSGMLIPVSRSISNAHDPAKAAEKLRSAINNSRQVRIRRSGYRLSKDDARYKLADRLLENGCIQFAEEGKPFVLKSGLQSPIYIDLRRLVSSPELMYEVATMYLPILESLAFDRLAALPYAAIPIATAISLTGGWPMIYPRKEVKDYGTRAEIEGEYVQGERVVVIDDLATTGGSKFEAIEKLAQAGLVVKDVVVLIDRQSGASEALVNAGYQMHAVLNLSDLIEHWSSTRYLSPAQVESVREFLSRHTN